jgi:hypothetical protein
VASGCNGIAFSIAICKFLYKQAGFDLQQAETRYILYGYSFISPVLLVTFRCYSNARAGEPTESDKWD